jgi:uncharacterized FlaG/YvyC family protein
MEEVVMHNDDTIKVPTWRPDTTATPSPIARAQRTRPVQPADSVPNDSQAAPAAKVAKPENSARHEPISLDELAENLRKMNMTFDLFEIQAKFIVDSESHDIKVIVRNTRTGEVIRSIPPAEFNSMYEQFMDGLGTTFTGTI